MASLVPLRKLNNSTTIPALGLGTVALFDESPDSVKSGILRAMKIGYRHFDSSSDYMSEEALGSAIKDAIMSGLVKREEVFVTTKIPPEHLHVEEILPQIQLSLSKLDMDYVDCFMIHWPMRKRPGCTNFMSTDPEDFLPLDWKVLWPAMEKLVELGLTKSLGVSNMGVKKLQELIPHAKILPAINQVEMHPQWQQEKLRAFCQKKNIHVSAWAPIGAPGVPYGVASVLENPILKEVAEKHKKTAAQICLRWVIEVGASALPKSFKEARQIQNFSIWDFKLTDDDHRKIKTIKQCSLCSGQFFPFLQGSPWTFEEFFNNEE